MKTLRIHDLYSFPVEIAQYRATTFGPIVTRPRKMNYVLQARGTTSISCCWTDECSFHCQRVPFPVQVGVCNGFCHATSKDQEKIEPYG